MIENGTFQVFVVVVGGGRNRERREKRRGAGRRERGRWRESVKKGREARKAKREVGWRRRVPLFPIISVFSLTFYPTPESIAILIPFYCFSLL